MKTVKCVYGDCRNKVDYLPVNALPLCQEHYDLHRFIMEHFFLSRWKPEWEKYAIDSELGENSE